MSYKRLIPCIFIKDGKAVRWIDDPTVVSKDVIELAKYYKKQLTSKPIRSDIHKIRYFFCHFYNTFMKRSTSCSVS